MLPALVGCGKQVSKPLPKSMVDLDGQKVATIVGSTQEKFMSEHYPQCNLLLSETEADMLLSLRMGKASAALLDGISLRQAQRHYPKLQALADTLYPDPCGFGFKDTLMCERFNRFLKELRVTGKLDSIVDYWAWHGAEGDLPLVDYPAPKGDLVVATAPFPPFLFLKDNRPQGMEAEILSRFCLQEGYRPVINFVNFSTMLVSLSTNKSQVICGSLSITEERKRTVLFSDPWLTVYVMPIVMSQEGGEASAPPATIESLEDLQGQEVAVLVGSTQSVYVKTHYPECKLKFFEDESEMVLAVSNGKAAAAMVNKICVKPLLKEKPHLKVAGPAIVDDPYGLGFKNPELRDRFNVFLQEIKASGLYQELVDYWSGDLDNCHFPEMDFPAPRGVLKVAASSFPPMTFLKDLRPHGLEVHLISLFCQKEGYAPEVTYMNFSANLAALHFDMVDIVGGGLGITPERTALLPFTDPYYVDSLVLVVNDYGIEQTNEGGVRKAWNSLSANFYNNLIKEKRYVLILDGLRKTLIIAVCALLLGTLLGMGLCAMRMRPEPWLYRPAKTYIAFMQGMPQVVLLMLMFYVVFASSNIDGLMVSVITFSLNFAAFVAEIFRTSITSVDSGQTEAGISLGFSRFHTFFRFVAPQALKRALPLYKSETISLVKITSIVGYIAVQDLTKASDIIRSRTFDAFFPLIFISILYFVMAWLLAAVVEKGMNALMRNRL